MELRLLVGAGLLLSAAGCITTRAVLVDPSAKFAKTCPAAVRLYTSTEQVLSPYVRVALLSNSGKTDDGTTEADLIESMRKKAAQIGANGLLLESIDEPGALVKIIGEVAKTGTERKARATAIYVSADSARMRSACPVKKR